MLARRLLFGALLIAAICGVAWGDITLSTAPQPAIAGLDLSRGSLVPLCVGILATLAAVEALGLARGAGHRPLSFLVLLWVIVIHGTAMAAPALSAPIDPQHAGTVLMTLGFMTIGCGQVLRRRTSGAYQDMGVSVFIIVYLGLLPSFITAIRATMPGSAGVWAVVWYVAVVKITDIGAYFTGLTLGRTKLIPAISPGKTVEGLAGGLLFATVSAVLLSRVMPLQVGQAGGPVDWVRALGFGCSVALLGQMGDLVESLLKRDADAKDSARLIPSFGGILDLLDSPVFAAPVGFLLIRSWLA